MKQSKPLPPPADFYRADTYRSQDSIGWLMHRTKQSIVHPAAFTLSMSIRSNAS